jgi:hypothetical protein
MMRNFGPPHERGRTDPRGARIEVGVSARGDRRTPTKLAALAFLPLSGGGQNRSKRNRNSIQRRVAVDQVDALPGDHDAAVGLHQAVQRGAAEQPLLLAAEFDHDQFGPHRAGVLAAPAYFNIRRDIASCPSGFVGVK